MQGLKKKLLTEIERLEHIVAMCEEKSVGEPEGRLRLSIDDNFVRYYHCKKGNRNSYINKSNIELARKLAQKCYNQKVYALALKRISQFRQILEDYEDNEIEIQYEGLHRERRKLIDPVEKTWQQVIECWEAESYIGKDFKDDERAIYTERGERVRSKSEKILADYFNRKGIHYKYEKPLNLKGLGLIYPDFSILSEQSRGEVFWEHFGMMDDSFYAEKAVRKINAYNKNGITIGKELIVTFETKRQSIDMNMVEKIVKNHLL